MLFDFSKKTKSRRIIASVICGVIVVGMIIGLLFTLV